MEILLDNCFAKLKRAKETINMLEKELNELVKDGKYSVISELQEEKKRYAFILNGEPINVRIPILAGEVIHHLRTILDYVVWEIASKKSPKNFNQRIQFPIYETEEKFKNALKNKKLLGIPEKFRDYIESIQPYNTTDPKNSVIQILHDLDILDKHKLLIVVSHAIKMGQTIKFTGNPSAPVTIIISEKNGPFFMDIEDGRETHWVNYETTSNTDWGLQNDFKITFVFEKIGNIKRKNVIEILNQIYENIEEILNKFKTIA
jgi:hypothetical protein